MCVPRIIYKICKYYKTVFRIFAMVSVNPTMADPIKATSDVAIGGDTLTGFPINRSLIIHFYPFSLLVCPCRVSWIQAAFCWNAFYPLKKWRWRGQTIALFRNKRRERDTLYRAYWTHQPLRLDIIRKLLLLPICVCIIFFRNMSEKI